MNSVSQAAALPEHRDQRFSVDAMLVPPEGWRNQNEQREYLETAQQHAGNRYPLRRIGQRHEAGGDIAQARAQVIQRRRYGRESRYLIKPGRHHRSSMTLNTTT